MSPDAISRYNPSNLTGDPAMEMMREELMEIHELRTHSHALPCVYCILKHNPENRQVHEIPEKVKMCASSSKNTEMPSETIKNFGSDHFH